MRTPRPHRYTVRLNTTLDPASDARLMAFIEAFRRPRGQVLRQVLEWSVQQGWTGLVSHDRASGTPHPVSALVTPALAAQVHRSIDAAGVSLARWLRHALHQITLADFPARWQDVDAQRPLRSHDSRQYARRLMVRFDEVTWQRLQSLARQADCSAAEVIRALIAQATGGVRAPSQEVHKEAT
jgi:macrodomain Ter protein organizer (MatP/YcbG family)